MIQNLPWLFLLLPLVVAAIDWLCFSKCPRTAASLSTLSAIATFALCVAYLNGMQTGTPDVYTWLPTKEGMTSLSMGLVTDALAMRMMLVVTGIGSLVHIFSLGYMKGDSSNLTPYGSGGHNVYVYDYENWGGFVFGGFRYSVRCVYFCT